MDDGGNHFQYSTFIDDYKHGRIVIDTLTLSAHAVLFDRDLRPDRLREQDDILKREVWRKTQGMERVGEPYVEQSTMACYGRKARESLTYHVRIWFQQVRWDHKRNAPA